MKNSMLLPYHFKKIGWVLFIPALLLGIVVALQESSAGMIEHFIDVQPWLNNLLIIGILCGSLFITCSREKVEDEMIARIRLDALLPAVRAVCKHGGHRRFGSRHLRIGFRRCNDLQSVHFAAAVSGHFALSAVAVEKNDPK